MTEQQQKERRDRLDGFVRAAMSGTDSAEFVSLSGYAENCVNAAETVLAELERREKAEDTQHTKPIHDHGYYPTSMKKEGTP